MEPVYIDIQTRQNVSEEAERATSAVEKLARASLNAREETKRSLALQEQYLTKLKTKIREVQKALSEAPKGTTRNSLLRESKALQAELADEEKALVALRTESDRLNTSSGVLLQRMTGIRAEMQELVVAGEANSSAYKALRAELGRLAEAQKQVQVEQLKLAKGATLDGVVEGIQAMAGAVSTATGAVVLLTGESEQWERVQAKLQGAMALVIGLQEVQNALSKTSAFQIQVVSRVTSFWSQANTKLALALWGSTGAAKALMATLTLGLSVAITAIMVGLDKLIAKGEKAREEQESLAESMAGTLAPQIAKVRELQKAWRELGDDLEARRRFIKEHQGEFEQLGIAIDGVNEAEAFFASKTDSFIESLKLRAKAMAQMERAVALYKEALEESEEAEQMKTSLWDYLKAGATKGAITAEQVRQDRENKRRVGAEEKNKQADALVERALQLQEASRDLLKKSGIKEWRDAKEVKASGLKSKLKDWAKELESLEVKLEQETTSSVIASMQEGARREREELEAKFAERKRKLREYHSQLEEIERDGGLNVAPQREQLSKLEVALHEQERSE